MKKRSLVSAVQTRHGHLWRSKGAVDGAVDGLALVAGSGGAGRRSRHRIESRCPGGVVLRCDALEVGERRIRTGRGINV